MFLFKLADLISERQYQRDEKALLLSDSSVKPFRYNSLVTGQRTKCIIALCWILSFGIGLTPMFGWNTGETFFLAKILLVLYLDTLFVQFEPQVWVFLKNLLSQMLLLVSINMKTYKYLSCCFFLPVNQNFISKAHYTPQAKIKMQIKA